LKSEHNKKIKEWKAFSMSTN